MKTNYRSFGFGIALRWRSATATYEVLARGSVVFSSGDRRAACDHAESLLPIGGDS